MKITLIGTGIYGIAIASMLAKNGHNIIMYSENNEKIKEYNETKSLKSIAKDYTFPYNIIVSGDLKSSIESAQVLFITCSSKYVKDMCNQIKPYYHNQPICIASKGIEEESYNLLSIVVKNTLNTNKIAVISGPTFATDILHNDPVALAIACKSSKVRNLFINLLSNDTLKLRKSKDMIGVQICGSVKNIIAIASGILGGLGYSESTQAFLINESLHDIKDLILFMGGKPRTILSFAGVGDLLMTSMSKKSRNYSFGFVIGSENDIYKTNEYLQNNTVEGYTTVKTVVKLLTKKNINIPLIFLINDIIDGKKDPKDLANFLIIKK